MRLSFLPVSFERMRAVVIKVIEGLPANVVGFEAIGEVEADDYVLTLKPAIDRALESGEKARLLYVLGPGFSGYSGGAMWEDTKLGVGHWSDWERIAVVTDVAWIGDGVKAFGWVVPGQVRLYSLEQLDDARVWVAA